MAATAEELEAAIREAVIPEFRESLFARGQARSLIWRDGQLPEDAPPFSPLLTYDLLSYGYSLLTLSLRLLELGGSRDIARLGFEHAAGAIESAVNKGAEDESRDFHRFVAAAAYHLGQFSARAYSMLWLGVEKANLSPSERALSLLMLRHLDVLSDFSISWRLSGEGSDETILTLIEDRLRKFENGAVSYEPDTDMDETSALDLALTDGFMAGVAIALLAFERGERQLLEIAIQRIRVGLEASAELGLVPHWWCHRLAVYLLGDLWESSFHAVLPKNLSPATQNDWQRLRNLFVALLYRRSRAEIELWPSQIDAAARAVQMDENLVVSLPTSSGKTRIAELCILATLAIGKRVVFVTPLRALSAQTEVVLDRTFAPLGKTVSSLYGSIGTNEVDENLLKDRHIVVATPEKLDFALRNDPSFIDDVGLIVLDEGHMIGIGEREVRYEAQIQRLLKRSDAKSRRIVCLSAILPTGDQLSDFVDWLTAEQGGELFHRDWRPTRLRYGEILWLGKHARLDVRVDDESTFVPKFLTEIFSPKVKGRASRRTPFPRDQRELCLAVAWRLIEEGQSVLIFCPMRASVEPFASAIVDLNERGILRSLLVDDDSVLASSLAIGLEWFGAEHPILKCLRLGVAIHHGALPTPFRKEIERLLRAGVLKVTVSSPTLAQGLNLSATALIVHSTMRGGEPISSAEFRNVVGRAGRAYVDLEGLVLHPMFDDHPNRKRKWKELIADDEGHALESGLLRLVMTLLLRMQQKLGTKDVNQLIEYVTNNAAAWTFQSLSSESVLQAEAEEKRWQGFLASLDTAILSLVGEADAPPEEIEAKLDALLVSSLWERRLKRRNDATRAALTAGLKARTRYIWDNSTASQRRGYFLAGVGFNTGKELDRHATELTALLLTANGSVLLNDEDKAIEAITAFADRIFTIAPFSTDDLPEKWKDILRAWLQGRSIAGITTTHSETEILQFIEQVLVYRLPWGMEAVRVRAIANGDKTSDGIDLESFELGLAAAAVESGTLSRQAAILMRAGFGSRMAAVRAVTETGATFGNSREMAVWVGSEAVSKLSENGNWPTKDTVELWKAFVQGLAPIARRTWSHRTYGFPVEWIGVKPPLSAGTGVRLFADAKREGTMVLSAEGEHVGMLRKTINPHRAGLLNLAVADDLQGVNAHYLGPDDIFARH